MVSANRRKTKKVDSQAAPSLLEPPLLAAVTRLERSAREIMAQLDSPDAGTMQSSLMRVKAIAKLREGITPPIRSLLVELSNDPHGFQTDRGPRQARAEDREPYPIETICECAIAALLEGLHWAGGQWAILDGQMYVTAAGWELKLNSVPGFTDLTTHPGVPFTHNGLTCVRFGAAWRLNGASRDLRDARGLPGIVFAVSIDERSTPEQLIGKARAKALKLIYRTITGSVQTCAGNVDTHSRPNLCIDDDQAELLDAAIVEHRADLAMIRDFYGLADGQRLMARDFAECLGHVRDGKFTGAAILADA